MDDNLFWLSDEQWAAIAPLMPKNGVGPKRLNDRIIISGIIHVLLSGCAWRECPRQYGPYMTVFNRFNRWKSRGIWQEISQALIASGHLPDLANHESRDSIFELPSRRTKNRDQRLLDRGALAAFSRRRISPAERAAATAELEKLIQDHTGQPISDWISDIVDWHLNSSGRA